jgi:hypothetical protein
MLQIGPQVPAPNLRRARSNVVFDIDLPPRIEDRAARRVSQAVEKCFDYWRSRQRPYDFAKTPSNGRGEGIRDLKSLAKPSFVRISTWPAAFPP